MCFAETGIQRVVSEPERLETRRRTDIGAEIHSLKDLDCQIVLHLAHHFHGVIEHEMGILRIKQQSKRLVLVLIFFSSSFLTITSHHVRSTSHHQLSHLFSHICILIGA